MDKENILVSACLMGIKCRYDGAHKENSEIISLMGQYNLIPVCPEQLGGLETPRPPAEQVGDKVLTIDGKDVTLNYEKGAQESLKIAKLYNCQQAYLKSDSPMCGFGKIYDGHFSGHKAEGNGILTKKLLKLGFKIISN